MVALHLEMKHPPIRRDQARGVLHSRQICFRRLDANRSLTNPQRFAADFNTGSHLEVGEFVSDRYAGRARRHPGDLPVTPVPSRDADNRKACRAHGPCRAELSDTETNRCGWHE